MNYQSKATMSAFMAGVMIGAFVLGRLADRVGRRATITTTVLGIGLFNTLSGLTASFTTYVAAKFLVGFFLAGNILGQRVLGNELVGASKRGIVGMTMQAAFAVGIVVFALVGWWVQHWRQLTLAISLPCLPFLLLHWAMPESPRWLLAQGRTSEATKVLLVLLVLLVPILLVLVLVLVLLVLVLMALLLV